LALYFIGSKNEYFKCVYNYGTCLWWLYDIAITLFTNLFRWRLMPFKSKAQRAKFLKMVEAGQLPKRTFDEWDRDTPKDLPERLNTRAKPIKKVKRIK
jgi:hypothetical protein